MLIAGSFGYVHTPNFQTIYMKYSSIESIPSGTIQTISSQLQKTAMNNASSRIISVGITPAGSSNSGLVTTTYTNSGGVSANFLYMSGGFSNTPVTTTFCIDHDHTGAVLSADSDKKTIFVDQIDTELGGIGWWQLMSQCHGTSNFSTGSQGIGAWWKYEYSFRPGEYSINSSSTNFASNPKLIFRGLTSCTTDYQKEYGCGTDDRK